MSEKVAKNISEAVRKSVIYQIFLRAFTPEGTLPAAEKLLPHLAGLGVDILYLCPIVLADDDPDINHWSERQRASGMNNPRSPYRLKDYFEIDPEYGTAEDLKRFVTAAHELGMRVMLDLVYYHCGPKANIIDLDPEFVVRDENGNVVDGLWHFPKLNFDSMKLREYLWSNMEYFVREFDVDGYRTDAEDLTPLDFWVEGRRRLEAIKPDIVLLAESIRPECQIAAYDMNYGWGELAEALKGLYLKKDVTPSALSGAWKKDAGKQPKGSRHLRATSNHDIANDFERSEKILGPKGFETWQLFNFVLDGIPFLYNGEEIADSARHCIFSNRDYGKHCIDWSNAVMPTGIDRMDFVSTLVELRHTQDALTNGEVIWPEQPEDNAIALLRKSDMQEILVVINPSDKCITATVKTDCARVTKPDALLLRDCDYTLKDGTLRADLLPYGFAVIELKG